ncbi:hypothetical protein E2542_SST29899 [Spatholobus suberectus]|nr:hypothetical protein E2542_SST29899 [Spatholobus suberectus]
MQYKTKQGMSYEASGSGNSILISDSSVAYTQNTQIDPTLATNLLSGLPCLCKVTG